MRIIATFACAAAVCAMAATGCNVGFEGNQGNLEFNYETDEYSAKKPVAVDTTVLLRTHLATTNQNNSGQNNSGNNSGSSSNGKVEVTNVASNKSSVIAVEGFAQKEKNSFVLSAKSAGTADITVDVKKADGTTVSDGFTLEAREAKKIELSHPCGESSSNTKPVYLTGQTVAVEKTLYGPNGDELTGRGLNPVDVSGPSSGAALADPAGDSNLLNVATGDTAGTITLSPTIGGKDLKLDVKDESKIDTVEWLGGSSSSNSKPMLLPMDKSKDEGVMFPTFEIGGRPVCKGEVSLSVDNKTPDVCSAATEHPDNPGAMFAEYGDMHTTVKLTAKKQAMCKFDVSVDGAGSGAKSSAEVDVSKL
ncbi:MAG: hypothetical protein ABEN55_05070 [Bradymonadaceae bacterium]